MAGDFGGASTSEGEGRVEEDAHAEAKFEEALHMGEHIAENRARLHEFTQEMLSNLRERINVKYTLL